MAEQLINEFTVNRPIDEAWSIITDVERIAPCLPGAQLTEIAQTDAGETYSGNVKVKLGPIATEFVGKAYFVERDDANYTCTLNGKGRDKQGRGNASADIAAKAQSLSPTSTLVVVTTDLHITGKIAQFGRGILGDVSAKLIDEFAQNLNEMIDADGLEAVAAPDDASDPATGDDATQDTADAAARVASTPGSNGPQPTIRKIAGPATEPIDLMEIGGSSIAKRAAPAVAVLLLILMLLRRRRG